MVSKKKNSGDKPEISVVIATYNRGALLKRALENLEKQTLPFESFEVIVVDDGSATPAEEVVGGHPRPYRFSLVRQNNGGAAKARHNGISRCSGSIIVIVDDDMEITERFLEQHLKAHSRGADVVLGRIVQSSDFSTMPLHNRFQQHQFNRAFEKRKPGDTISGAGLYTGNVSFKRELYDRVGGFDLNLKQNEDRELGIRFEKAGAKFAFASEAVTANGSDHTDFNRWMEESRRYGVLDMQISKKHQDVASADPIHFLFRVNPLSVPVLSTVMLVPSLAPVLSRTVMKVSSIVDELHLERLALAGTTLAYGIQYYRGVRDEAGSTKEVLKNCYRYLKKRKV
ncbi:MAG: glycosyltransferase family 2 protein [Deltaproteobacteria bacterium]|nr:glycosyltransferase family 2 protein [Deltaproteobacteria bacterium]